MHGFADEGGRGREGVAGVPDESAARLRIAEEDPTSDDVTALLALHLAHMRASSPACSMHALDVEALRPPAVRFWTARDGTPGASHAALLGCGALKRLDSTHGELKSMRTAPTALRRGVARALLARIVAEARADGLERLSLETGSGAPFEPALRLYERAGFVRCPPFGDYTEDPFSLFMTRALEPVEPAG